MSIVTYGLGLTAPIGTGPVTQFIDGVEIVENIEVELVTPLEVAILIPVEVELLEPIEVEVE